MNVPLLDLKAQYAAIRDEVRAAIDEVFEHQRFILGPQVAKLEEEIALYCAVPHAVAVASGTDALILALRALGVGAGDSVITVPYTFFATAGAIWNLGARPLFVDIEETGYGMDPRRLSDCLERECVFSADRCQVTHRSTATTVKAVVAVHLYGQCAEMDEIREIARRFHLAVVEDACQAIGARYRGLSAGSLGDFGCFSFFPSKNLGGAGDGGMVVARDETLAQRVRLLRTHGGQQKYYHSVVGFNSRLDEVQAAVLRVKLRYLDRWTQARRENAAAYRQDFLAAGLLPRIKPPAVLPEREHIFHQYVIRAPKRNELQAFLRSRGIGTEIYYPLPLHEQECFRPLGYAPTDFPQAHAAAQSTLALPIYAELEAEQRRHVVESIAEFYRQ
jgi:dTDP-4-amino-4,6-dideoxygalactose transaminase